LTDANAVKIIKEGIVDKAKRRWILRRQLNDEEIKALIAYIRAFKK